MLYDRRGRHRQYRITNADRTTLPCARQGLCYRFMGHYPTVCQGTGRQWLDSPTPQAQPAGTAFQLQQPDGTGGNFYPKQ